MLEADFDPFAELLDATYSLHGKTLPATAKAIFFRAMASYPLPVVRKSIDAHVKDPQRGQYAPKPSDLIAQIEGMASDDGRPGAEEAWAIAVQAFDESTTVMLNEEISEARGIARPIFELGDEVGARMAFREAYARLVGQARAAGVRVRWWPSLGTDPVSHKDVLLRAVAQGLLSANAPVLNSLALPSEAMPLLQSAASAAAENVDARETFDALKKLLSGDPEGDERRRQERLQDERDAVQSRKVVLMRQAQALGLSDDGYGDMAPLDGE